MNRTLSTLRSRIPEGCPVCREMPHRLVILHDGDSEPADTCPGCGRPYPTMPMVRITVVDRGPK